VINYISLDEEQRQHDPLPTINTAKIRNKREEPFPIEHRSRIATALETLAELQQLLFQSLFPPEGE